MRASDLSWKVLRPWFLHIKQDEKNTLLSGNGSCICLLFDPFVWHVNLILPIGQWSEEWFSELPETETSACLYAASPFSLNSRHHQAQWWPWLLHLTDPCRHWLRSSNLDHVHPSLFSAKQTCCWTKSYHFLLSINNAWQQTREKTKLLLRLVC